MNRLSRALLFAGAATALLAAPRTARADDEPPKVVAKTAVYVWDKGILRVSIPYREVVDDEIAKKLSSGFSNTIVLRIGVYEEGADSPIAATFKSCRVTFDPWEEVYTFKVAQPGGEITPSPAPNLEGVLNRCATAQGVALVARSRLVTDRRYVVQGVVEVNPLSPELLERIRKWVSRPSGATTIGAGDALFSSFVGLFVTRIGDADRVLRFRTQPFTAQ